MSDSVPKYHRYRLGTVPAQIPGGEHCPVPAGLPERGEAEAPDPATPTPPFADKCAAVPRTTSADGVAHVSEAPGNRVQILAWTDALRSLPETHRRLQVTHRFARSLAGVSVGAVRRLDSTLASSVNSCYRMSPKLLIKSVMSSRRFIEKLRPFSSGAMVMLRPFAPPITPSPFKLRRWLLGITA